MFAEHETEPVRKTVTFADNKMELSLKMAECIENILWTTTECMLPKRKPKFVVCFICTSIYLTFMK
jgi:hypothetical protein